MGTPNCFEVADDIGRVFVVGIDERYEYLLLDMCEGAEVPVVTYIRLLVVELTELGFVSGGVVQLFDLIVRLLAVAVGLGAGDVTVIVEIGSPSVFLVVVVQADFPFMLVCIEHRVPFRLHLTVLKVAMSNRKNSPCSKKETSPLWSIQQ